MIICVRVHDLAEISTTIKQLASTRDTGQRWKAMELNLMLQHDWTTDNKCTFKSLYCQPWSPPASPIRRLAGPSLKRPLDRMIPPTMRLRTRTININISTSRLRLICTYAQQDRGEHKRQRRRRRRRPVRQGRYFTYGATLT